MKYILFLIFFVILIISLIAYLLIPEKIIINETLNYPVVNTKKSEPYKIPTDKPAIPLEENKIVISQEKTLQEPENIKLNEDIQKNDKQIFTNSIDFYQPIYDEKLERSKASMTFLVYDLEGKLLEPNIVKNVRIWRIYKNNLWNDEFAYFDHVKSSIICKGLRNSGIEPGIYEGEIDGGGYGIQRFSFIISKNENKNAVLKMPNYAKTIKLNFISPDGKGVDYIKNLPKYQWEDNKPINYAYKKKNLSVLMRSPEKINHNEYKKNETILELKKEKNLIESSNTNKFVYKLNNGIVFIRVFKNQNGSITYKYGENESDQSEYSLADNFVDLETISIPIKNTIIPNLSLEKVIDLHKEESTEIAGFNINNKIENQKQKPDFFSTKMGVQYQIKGSKFPLYLNCLIGENNSFLITGDDFLFQQNFDNFKDGEVIKTRIVDQKFFKTEWETYELQKDFSFYKEYQLNPKQFTLTVTLTPTFNAMAKSYSLIEQENEKFSIPIVNDKLTISSLYIPDSPQIIKNVQDAKLVLISCFNISNKSRDAKFIKKFLPKGAESWTSDNLFINVFKIPLSINPNPILKGLTDLIDISPIKNSIITRVVDYEGGGIPLVEASAIPYEYWEIAKTIRKILATTEYNYFFSQLTEIDFEDAKEKKSGPVYDKLLKIFSNHEVVEYYLNMGTWYNSKIRSVSDINGFMILNSEEFLPSKKYVICFWANSTNELKPDKEIIIKTDSDVTDLGRIIF